MPFSYSAIISGLIRLRHIIMGNLGKIMAALFGLMLFNFVALPIYQGPDFTLSVDTLVYPYSMAGEWTVKVSLEGTNNFRDYSGIIGLIALERGRPIMPEGINAIFQGGPVVFMNGNKQTKELLINVTNDANEGGHLIDILAFSKDGKERKCSFYFYFVKIPD